MASAAAASDWPKYCSNLAMTGVADNGGLIAPDTVHLMTQRWSLKLSGPVASSPTVVHDVVYVGDWSGMEWAISAIDGNVIAGQNLGKTSAPQCVPDVIGITSAPAYAEGVIYVAGGDDAFYALDAKSLAVKWRRSLGDNSAKGGYYGWCSPAVTGASVLQGISSDCDNPYVPGGLISMERETGDFNNDARMSMPDAPGAGVWTSPAVDLDNDDVFITTASGLAYGGDFGYSIVRLALDNLTVEDSWRIPDDNLFLDSDWGTSPTLFTDRFGAQLVGAGQKNGFYYAFFRYYLSVGPVWAVQLADSGACPQCGHGVLSTAAFDGKRLYVGAGRPPYDTAPTSFGSVVALDPSSGHVIWQHLFDGPVIAPISYANGVVFTTAGSVAAALDAESGAVLWSFQAPAVCVGGVAITDRGIFFGDLSGRLYSFGIPESPPRRRVAPH